jgi:hypothetical protein
MKLEWIVWLRFVVYPNDLESRQDVSCGGAAGTTKEIEQAQLTVHG